MRHVVVHLQSVFHMLGLVDEIKSMHLGFSAFAVQIHMIGVADVAAVESDDHDFQAAVGHLPHLELALDGGLVAHVLQHIQLKAGVLVEDDFGNFRIGVKMRIIIILNEFAALVGGYDKLVVHGQSSLIHS